MSGIQGTVELAAAISKEGVPLELRVISSSDDDLSESALEAVGQWRYRPTLLNGEPMEIETVVTISCTLMP
jgi:protein TonB